MPLISLHWLNGICVMLVNMKWRRFPKQLKHRKSIFFRYLSRTFVFWSATDKISWTFVIWSYVIKCSYAMGHVIKKFWHLSDFIPYGYNIFQTTADIYQISYHIGIISKNCRFSTLQVIYLLKFMLMFFYLVKVSIFLSSTGISLGVISTKIDKQHHSKSSTYLCTNRPACTFIKWKKGIS